MERTGAVHRVSIAVGFALLLFGAGTAAAQTAEQPAPQVAAVPAPGSGPGGMMSTAGRVKLQFDGYLGAGLGSSTVGVTNKGEDVKISGGGGIGGGVTLGYGLSQRFDIEGALGVQVSHLEPAVSNADGSFTRSFLLATAKYKVPFRENLQWKFGLGAGYYTGGKLDINIDPGIPGAGHTIIDYKSAAGVHATGELEILLRERLTLCVGLKYYKVTYKAEKTTFNGASQPVALLKDEYRNFKGDGIDITAGVGVLF